MYEHLVGQRIVTSHSCLLKLQVIVIDQSVIIIGMQLVGVLLYSVGVGITAWIAVCAVGV